jgi:hypothetical protein
MKNVGIRNNFRKYIVISDVSDLERSRTWSTTNKTIPSPFEVSIQPILPPLAWVTGGIRSGCFGWAKRDVKGPAISSDLGAALAVGLERGTVEIGCHSGCEKFLRRA